MKIFYGSVSGNSARAVFGSIESGAPVEYVLVDTNEKENKSAGYLAVNPMGKIPALSDGDFHLWESNAINLYAAETSPSSKLIPATPQGRASMQRWLFFQSAHVTPACVPLFQFTNPAVQKFWNTKGDAAAAEKARKELARFLPIIEAALADRDWLEGEFSLADVAYAPHLWLIRGGGFDETPYPRMRAWLDRMFARPGWKATEKLVFGGG